MNVREMVQGVKRELQSYPDSLKFDRDIKAALTVEYHGLAGEQEWAWLRRSCSLWTGPDITMSAADLVRRGERTFTISRSALTTAGFGNTNDLTDFGTRRPLLVGAEFDLADRTLAALGDATWERGPFEVEYVHDWVGGGALDKFYLDPRMVWNSTTGDEGDFALKFRRYRLPSDVASVLGLAHGTDKVPLTPLTIGEMSLLRQDVSPGRSTHYALDVEGTAPRIAPAFYPDEGLTGVAWEANGSNEDAFGFRNRAPDGARWTVSSTSVADTTQFPNGQWEVGIAWYYGGRWSPMSIKPLRIDHSTGYGNVVVADTPAMDSDEYGRRIGVFVSRAGGSFALASMWGAANITGATITSNPFMKQPGTLRRHDEMFPSNGYQFVRVWPRPSVTTMLQLHYLVRPLQLLDDGDAPLFHESHHDVIVLRTALRFLTRNEQAEAFRRVAVLADQAYARMCRRYNAQAHIRATKGRIDAPRGLRPWTPTINWNGDT